MCEKEPFQSKPATIFVIFLIMSFLEHTARIFLYFAQTVLEVQETKNDSFPVDSFVRK